MTRVLLDTHAFLWFVFDDPRLSERADAVISDPEVAKLLSVVSLWEVVIKQQLGKLRLGSDVATFFDRQVSGRLVEVVPLELGHLVAYDALPLVHRDPFDRALVAQARVEGVPLVTADARLAEYDVEVVW